MTTEKPTHEDRAKDHPKQKEKDRDEFTAAFITWMDGLPANAEAIGKPLGVSAQTIRNWRAAGIPPRKVEPVRQLMRDWQPHEPADLGKIILRPTPAQFDRWNDAANAAGQRISQWALEGLDQLAAEWEQKPRLVPDLPARYAGSKVAEEPGAKAKR